MKLVRVFAAVILLAALVGSIGCNTFKGLGRDVEKGGEKIQDVSEDAKPSNNK